MPARTFYDILQVSPTASENEIKAAYRALAWNPSVAGDQDELRQINEAYATLSSPQRRAAYDQTFTTETVVDIVPARPVPNSTSVADAENVPLGPFLLRAWGRITQGVWHMSRARYRFIPITWIFGGLLIGLLLTILTAYNQDTNQPTPMKTTLMDVVRKVPVRKYITMIGTADYESGYTAKGQNTETRYYVLVAGKNVILFTGPKDSQRTEISGLLRPFESKLADKVKAEAKDPYWAGFTLLTTYYLDTTYRPTAAGLYMVGFAILALALMVLIVPALRRYTVFVAAARQDEEPANGEIVWPVLVEATGKFRPAQGRGWGLFHADAAAQVTPGTEPGSGFTVLAWFHKDKVDRLYRIPIPPGSRVRVGLNYAGGRARPALAVATGGQTIYLRLTTMTDARRLAEIIGG